MILNRVPGMGEEDLEDVEPEEDPYGDPEEWPEEDLTEFIDPADE
jgi:hypothetical protein